MLQTCQNIAFICIGLYYAFHSFQDNNALNRSVFQKTSNKKKSCYIIQQSIHRRMLVKLLLLSRLLLQVIIIYILLSISIYILLNNDKVFLLRVVEDIFECKLNSILIHDCYDIHCIKYYQIDSITQTVKNHAN